MNLLDYVKMPTQCRHIAEEHPPPEILGRYGDAGCVLAIWCVESIGSAVLGLRCCGKRRLPSKRVWHRQARRGLRRPQTKLFFLISFAVHCRNANNGEASPPFFSTFLCFNVWVFLQKAKGKATRAMDVSQLHFCPLLASPPVRCWCNDRHLLGRKFSGGPRIDVPQLIHKLRCAGSASCVTKGFP